MDDATLVAGYLAGDAETHRQVDRWIEEVLRSRPLGLGADREDVGQEARRRLLTALRAGRFEGRCSPRTYVWRVAQSAAIDHLRARARRGTTLVLDAVPEPVAATGHPAEGLEREERRRLFARVLEGMGEDCRRLWAMAVFEELPYAHIAARLGVTEGSVKVRALRCRARAAELYRSLVTSPDGGRPSVKEKAS
jgi:RNA polymerase sigma-70 factor (ECF subfamily)